MWAGEAHGAGSAHTQGRMSEAQALLGLLQKECPHMDKNTSRRPTHWDIIEEPVVRLERDLYGHHLVLPSLHFLIASCRLVTHSWKNPHTELQIKAPHGATQCKTLTKRLFHPEMMKVQALYGGTHCVLRNTMAPTLMLLGQKFAKKQQSQNKRYEGSIQ